MSCRHPTCPIWDGHDPRWDMKLQEDSFYTQAATQELRLPTNVTSVPTLVKSRHWLDLDIWGNPWEAKMLLGEGGR